MSLATVNLVKWWPVKAGFIIFSDEPSLGETSSFLHTLQNKFITVYKYLVAFYHAVAI